MPLNSQDLKRLGRRWRRRHQNWLELELARCGVSDARVAERPVPGGTASNVAKPGSSRSG